MDYAYSKQMLHMHCDPKPSLPSLDYAKNGQTWSCGTDSLSPKVHLLQRRLGHQRVGLLLRTTTNGHTLPVSDFFPV